MPKSHDYFTHKEWLVQIHGTALGYPVSEAVASLVMGEGPGYLSMASQLMETLCGLPVLISHCRHCLKKSSDKKLSSFYDTTLIVSTSVYHKITNTGCRLEFS